MCTKFQCNDTFFREMPVYTCIYIYIHRPAVVINNQYGVQFGTLSRSRDGAGLGARHGVGMFVVIGICEAISEGLPGTRVQLEDCWGRVCGIDWRLS